MGAFRSQLEALGVQKFWDGSDTRYSSGAGYTYSYAVIGSGLIRLSGSAAQPSLVKTETTPHHPGTFFISDMRGPWSISASGTAPDIDQGTIVFTGIFEGDLTPTPPQVGPDVISSYGLSTGPSYAHSSGFFRVDYRSGSSVAWWDLHITAAGTVGIATWTTLGWGDLMHVDSRPGTAYIQWQKRAVYEFDTGFPAAALFDGRPHLISTRFRAHSQNNVNSNTALPQDNWIKVTIDGTTLPTTTRGPGVIGYVPWLEIGTYAFDDAGVWNYNLADSEVASLWGTAVWGNPWSHPGAGLTSSLATAVVAESIVRVVDWPPNLQDISGPRVPQKWSASIASAGFDPTWVEAATLGGASASAIVGRSSMGDATSQLTWEESDTWAALPFMLEPKLASKWLENQNVALLAVPIRGAAVATGNLGQEADRGSGSSHGRSSISGELTLAMRFEAAAPAHGSSTVFAITIGDLDSLAGRSDGAASVVGALNHGQLEPLAASSAGGSVVVGDLGVTRYSYLVGEEVGDGEGAPRMGVGGRRRAHFSPKSIGRVDSRIRVQGVSAGIDGSGLGS